MQILGTRWFTHGTNCIGVVWVRLESGKEMVYMGVGDGQDEQTDAKNIAEWGAKLHLRQAIGFFPLIKNYKLQNTYGM